MVRLSLFELILEHLFGRKYYAVIIHNTFLNSPKHPAPDEISSYVFHSRQLAQSYVEQNVPRTQGYAVTNIVSFRSRKPLVSNFNPQRHLDFSKFS